MSTDTEYSNYKPTYARALTTQESHRHTGTFKPYKYRGTGHDTISNNDFRPGTPHPTYCGCKKHGGPKQ
ncbi:hypothetical protein [Glutamicibacter sp. FBE19]|uniref:hypothetical protein n=1 Tax=Glutamicibacter sp. FBE19 TaxID=2761534 RepID=UPI0019D66B17|nr:hypothetical protein [Glutamicibacter sp. FBE19]MBF6671573.1 hypothetical protein [Glutamicibacter sp. FBE19]